MPKRASPVLRASIGLLLCASAAASRAAEEAANRSYRVDRVVLEYALDHPEHPPLAELQALEVAFTPVRGGYREPIPRNRTVAMRLDRIPRGSRFFTSALVHLNRALLAEFERRGIGGVVVTAPDLEQGSGRDLRPRGATELRLRIWTGRVARVSSFADGERFGALPAEQRSDHPAHARIRERAPSQAGGARDLLRARALEDYALRLSRHPGRRVDAELSPGREPGTTHVNLRVAETRPWWVYAQLSNTGTPATSRLRERFGIAHAQLSGRDDVLRLDYVTGDFDEVHGVFGSYEFPTPGLPRLRWRGLGSHSRYDVSQLGFGGSDFSGRHWDAGFGARLELLQLRELFLDLDAQFRWQHVRSENPAVAARTDFALPRAGWQLERQTLTSALHLEGHAEFNWSGLAGRGDVDDLGRDGAVTGFLVWRWAGSLSLFLEPLLDPGGFQDPQTPGQNTLAHELALSFRAQTTRHRLPPTHEEVVGGFYSVRGYRESLIAGDRLALGSVEYRFHLPRALRANPEPWRVPLIGAVHAVPAHVYGVPDWDLIFRGFLDAARIGTNETLRAKEPEATLVSAGVGLELQLLRHFNARLDLGVPLEAVDDPSSAGGELARRFAPRLHFAVTGLY